MSEVRDEIHLLTRARYPIIYLVTWEENRASEILADVAKAQRRELVEWTVTSGLRRVQSEDQDKYELDKHTTDPTAALEAITLESARGIYVMRDLHRFLGQQATYPQKDKLIRKLRDACPQLKRSGKSLIVCAPVLELPTEMEKDTYIVNLAPPDKDELMDLLKGIARKASKSDRWKVNLSRRDAERLIDAVLGLTLEEAERVFVKALIRDGSLSAKDIPAVREEKEQIVHKSGLLEYVHVDDTIAQVGGLGNLKEWIKRRSKGFGPEARRYGLPPPKGILLLGVQGCGKSLCAKAVSALWHVPLLRLDMSRIFGRFVGASEDNMRKALATAESIAPALLWVDEIEKAFSGIRSSGSADAGTTSRVFGSFITWLQENPSEVFVIATANSIDALPPELLRKGRFDEIFFVDLPVADERQEILHIHLKRRNRERSQFDVAALTRDCEGFSGAEIEQAIVSALYDGFYDDREICQDDIARAIAETVPLSVTRREDIEALRNWARERARPAS